MEEKRKFIRFQVALTVSYIEQKEPRIEKTGLTKNVSLGGMHLLTEEELKTGTKIELKLFIPNALNPVHLNGMVLMSKELSSIEKKLNFHYGTTVEFEKIEDDNKNTFLQFLCDLLYGKKSNN